MVTKTLDQKLARIHADPHGCKDFILADAKDADMALAIGAPGRSPEAHGGEVRFRTLAQYRDLITEIVEQELVDVMLMSASTSEVLTIHRRLFDKSTVTPAARANDTTDIHVLRGGKYVAQPSLPFRTATLDHIQCGHLDCTAAERSLGANLGLYSITFSNDARQDRENLEEYRQFRLEAERKGFRHFLEIFDPNVPGTVAPEHLACYINDAIVRAVGGVTSAGRPLFLKIVYHGPKAMEELVRYDPHLVVGILGGSAGTTYDAFKLLAEAKKYGARVALFGRKINNAENQLAFVRFLRLIADDQITAEEAVKAYHGVLQRLNIPPQRPLDQDMQLQTGIMSYGGSEKVISVGGGNPTPPAPLPQGGRGEIRPPKSGRSSPRPQAELLPSPKRGGEAGEGEVAPCPCKATAKDACACKHPEPSANGEPDFKKMTNAEKIAYNRARWKHILG